MIKKMIKTINRALFNDEMTIDVALQLLSELSILSGKRYDVIAKRVVIFEDDGKMHDAYVNS